MRNVIVARIVTVLCTILVLAAGCTAPDTGARHNLNAGYTALSAGQFDEAIARADSHVRANPEGPGTAEALYLKGRALEARTAGSDQEAQANLHAARMAYVQALSMQPPQPLLAYVRTSLGNVCYFQEDYVAAARELFIAYEQLESPELRAWALYRAGLSLQRLGRFEQADQTLAQVIRDHPGSVPAERARQLTGVRAYNVQVGVFSQPALAEKAMASLRQQGLPASRTLNAAGQHVITVGPAANYAQAQTLKARVTPLHPDAMIVP
jgi:tetratricopeptide (TPR) repeat protein